MLIESSLHRLGALTQAFLIIFYEHSNAVYFQYLIHLSFKNHIDFFLNYHLIPKSKNLTKPTILQN